ncbi:50S ribosomal protein L11 [Spiroplasma clarkii]|nr:50S ribosomal protein L11 [Spiroplasma clarkii]
MAKKITRIAKLEFMAMQAKPGAELASLGINMPQFTQQFNDATKDRAGEIVPVVITAYDDKSFDFVLKTTPAAFMLKKQQESKRIKNSKRRNYCNYYSRRCKENCRIQNGRLECTYNWSCNENYWRYSKKYGY